MMADERDLDNVPADPFPELTSAFEDAIWLREQYEAFVMAGFTKHQALRLTSDHLRYAFYGRQDGVDPD